MVLSCIWEKLPSNDSAISAFEDAIEIKPDLSKAYYNLACLYISQNQSVKAMKTLKHSIDLDPRLASLATTDSDLSILRESSEFQEMIEKAHLSLKTEKYWII